MAKKKVTKKATTTNTSARKKATTKKAAKDTAVSAKELIKKGMPEPQKQAIRDMTPPVRQLYMQLKLDLDSCNRSHLRINWSIGDAVREIYGDIKKYGDNQAELIAQAFDIPTRNIWDAKKVVTVYSWEDVEGLEQRARDNGVRLSWSHLNTLSRLKGPEDAKLRKRLETRIVKEGVSANDLSKAIAQLNEENIDPQDTEEVSKTLSSQDASKQVKKLLKSIEKSRSEWEGVLFDWVENATLEEIPENYYEQILDAKDSLDQLLTTVSELHKGAQKAVNHLISLQKDTGVEDYDEELDEAESDLDDAEDDTEESYVEYGEAEDDDDGRLPPDEFDDEFDEDYEYEDEEVEEDAVDDEEDEYEEEDEEEDEDEYEDEYEDEEDDDGEYDAGTDYDDLLEEE